MILFPVLESGYTYVDPDLANNPSSNSTQVKGFVTGTLNRVIEGSMADNLLLSVNYYDEYGRVIRAISDNHLGEKDVVYTDYNFVGEPEQVILRHNISGTTEDIKLTTNYVYDHQGRLLTENMQVDNEDEICIAAYSYNELGEVMKKYLHGNSSNQYFNQVVDFTYNVKGWLKKINNIGSLQDDLFAFELRYDSPGPNYIEEDSLFNGNISAMMWQTVSDAAPKGYGFQYDGLNRLSVAGYADGSSFNQHVDYNFVNYGYDTNGNIDFIERRLGNESGYQIIDELEYYYNTSSNQISHVNDNSYNPLGYHDNDGTNITYQYDANGNLFRDYSKGIEISYNYLNLPDYIDFGEDDEISYYYTADGTKVRKDVVGANSENSVVVDYVGPFIYENDELKAIFTSVGRIIPFISGSDVLYKYEYNLKDHLGNTRVMFAGHSNGQPELMQTAEYYPFGMVMNKQNYFGEAEMENDYLYNGKEQQNDELSGVSLDWYDYGARMYDAELGRWHVVDPMADMYYESGSYNYVLDNPLNNIDPEGLYSLYFNGEKVSGDMKNYLQYYFELPKESNNDQTKRENFHKANVKYLNEIGRTLNDLYNFRKDAAGVLTTEDLFDLSEIKGGYKGDGGAGQMRIISFKKGEIVIAIFPSDRLRNVFEDLEFESPIGGKKSLEYNSNDRRRSIYKFSMIPDNLNKSYFPESIGGKKTNYPYVIAVKSKYVGKTQSRNGNMMYIRFKSWKDFEDFSKKVFNGF